MSKCRYDLSVDCNNKDCLKCVLDKISVEIEELDGYEDRYSMIHDRPSLVRRVRNDCLKIIDKYKKTNSYN